ncbi:MAG: type II toxin-antitoxin system HigB family toxin [Pseudomonadota bacterium]
MRTWYSRCKHIIKVKTLREFWNKHPDVEQPLKTLVSVVEKAGWRNQEDVKASYPGVTPIGNNRFVFKRLKGNDYRLIIKVNYKLQKVFIRFIGTHSQYDRIDADSV